MNATEKLAVIQREAQPGGGKAVKGEEPDKTTVLSNPALMHPNMEVVSNPMMGGSAGPMPLGTQSPSVVMGDPKGIHPNMEVVQSSTGGGPDNPLGLKKPPTEIHPYMDITGAP